MAGMVRARSMRFLGFLVAWLPGIGCAGGDEGRVEALIRSLCPDMRRIEERLDGIAREMERLPVVKKEPWGSRD